MNIFQTSSLDLIKRRKIRTEVELQLRNLAYTITD